MVGGLTTGGIKMPKLGSKKFSYDKAGMKKYIKALKKKRKKSTEEDKVPAGHNPLPGGLVGNNGA